MIISALCFLLTHAAAQDSPRLKTELPNGVTILAEKWPGAKVASVQLFAGARGLDETAQTHGRRHLLEHLLVKGEDKSLDRALETKGMFLTAETLRDGTRIAIDCTTSQIDEALSSLSGLITSREFSQEEIEKEAGIIAEEIALQTDPRLLSKAAWTAGFGEAGLDTDGNPSELAKTTPSEISALQRSLFRSSNLVIVISGAVDLEQTTKQAAAIFSTLPKSERVAWQVRPDAKGATVEEPTVQADAIGVPVPSVTEPRCAWTLAAALAMGTEIDYPFVTYTPSIRNGLVLLGCGSDESALREKIRSIKMTDEERLLEVGRRLALRWISMKLESPKSSAYWRGYLLSQAPGATFDAMTTTLKSMTLAEFRQGMAGFSNGNEIHVAGNLAAEKLPNPKPDLSLATFAPIKERENSEQSVPASCLEMRIVGCDEVAAEAVVRLPSDKGWTMADARVLGETLLMGNAYFSEAQIRSFCYQTGRPPRVEVMPDHLRISLSFPAGQADTAASMVASMLRRTEFSEETVRRAKGRLTVTRDVWQRALWPMIPFYEKVTLRRVKNLYEKAMRPERVSVCFAGDFPGGAATAAWEKRIGDWEVRKEAPLPFDQGYLPAYFSIQRTAVRTMTLSMPFFYAWDGAFSTRLLATCALGVGKGSSVFRVLREKSGWSYRQEATVLPVPGGFTPALVFATTKRGDPSDAQTVREALSNDVMGWTEADRLRALGIARAALVENIVDGPLYLCPDGPIGDSLSDKAFFSAYCEMKFGKQISWDVLLKKMEMVRLEDLKEMAMDMLDKASISEIRPRE